MLTLSEVEYLLKQVQPITKYVYLHVQGEPLMHNEFDSILSLCDDYDMKVQLVTNGILLDKHISILEHPSLRKVSISLQSIEYNDLSVEDYMNAILNFVEKAEQQSHPYIELRFWRSDQKDMERTKYCLKVLKEHFSFQPSDRKQNYKIGNHTYVDFDNSFDWPDINTYKESNIGYCHGALDQIAILSNGTVTACCLDADGFINFGNVFEKPLKEILKTERYTTMVKNLHNHKLSEKLCQKCTFRTQFDSSIHNK